MKLGVVTTSYPRFAGDPAGNFVEGHVAALRGLGHTVDVIAAGDGPDRIPAGRLFYAGGAPDRLERAPLAALPDALRFSARMVRAIARRARDWDAVIAHWLVPSALAALAARKPLLAIVHGGDLHTLRRWHLLGPTLRLLRGAEVAFVSAELRALAAAHAPWLADALVQPMGIDVARFAGLPRTPSDPPIVLVAARLVPIKGVDVALAAMRCLPRRAELVILGDGPERERLRGLGAARFVGEVSTVERDAWLARASVVVVPSRVTGTGRSEGMPTIALEALAAGVPVIASAVGGLPSLPNITAVPPDDPASLAAAIDRALATPANPDLLRAAMSGFDWRAVASRLLLGARTPRRAA